MVPLKDYKSAARWSRESLTEDKTHITRDRTESKPSELPVRSRLTPGGRLVAHYLTKKVAAAQTEWLNGERIGGIPRLGGNAQRRLSKSERRVNRPYGGVITASALKDKYLRFTLEF